MKIKRETIVIALLVAFTIPGISVTNQSEGALQDNFDNGTYDYLGYHNRMQDSSDQLEPGAETERNWNLSDVFGADYRVYDSRDSTRGPDNWGLSKYPNASIANRGQPYLPGTINKAGCYYRSGVEDRTTLMSAGDDKRDKIFGNSFANARDWDGDGVQEGVWDDPDDPEVDAMYMNFTKCDLTGYDKGIGVDNGTDDQGVFRFKFDDQSTNVSIGDIAFADEDGKSDNFEQESPVCGDDHKEYLVEELGESENSMNRSGSYACSGRRDVCVARHGGEYAIYRGGDLVETDEASEEFGRSKDDKEVCETDSTNTRFGVWYDQDYSKEYCQDNSLYGSPGVRWFNSSFVDNHPYAVIEGLDDDMNPYLYNRERYEYTSTQGDVSYSAGETPVPTGRNVSGSIEQYYSEYNKGAQSSPNYKNLVASKGFCAGDDSDEHLIVQEASTSLLNTNYSVIAVADDSSDCVLDGDNYPDKISHDDRKVYGSGDQVTVDLGSSQRQVSCYAGEWHSDWPVVFLKENISVEEGNTATAEFQVINVESTQTQFKVTLDAPTELEPHTEFSQGGVQFTTTVPGEETEIYGVDIFGINSSIGPEDLKVKADDTSSNINGSDSITANIVDNINQSTGVENATQQPNEVPGIGITQLLFVLSAAYIFYMNNAF